MGTASQTFRGRAIQAEGTVSAKALRQDHACGLDERREGSAARVLCARVKVAGEGGEERAERQGPDEGGMTRLWLLA